VDFGLQIVTTCWSSNKLLSHGLQVISILMPQAKTPKPGFVDRCPVSNAWSSDPYAPVPTCHYPSGSQNQCRCVMFLACQIADAASCLRKITNRINLWMPSHASRPSLKKKWREKANLAAQYLPCWEQHAATTHHQRPCLVYFSWNFFRKNLACMCIKRSLFVKLFHRWV